MDKKKVIVLGGGFAGVYTAMYLEKQNRGDLEISLINRENYFVYQPMLAEVIGGSVGLLDTVSPLRRLLRKTDVYIREVDMVDLETKTVTLSPKFSHTPLKLSYDHLVIALGNVTDFRQSPGLHEHALPFKTLSDAIRIRNHLIEVIEAAAIEKKPEKQKQLLTFVVGGGGFSGTECVAELNDLVRKLAKRYDTIDPEMIRVLLVHSKDRLMDRELSPSLGEYAAKILQKRGVELCFQCHLKNASPQEAFLDNGERIPTRTVISTVPSSPHPLIESLDLPKEKGKIITENTMAVPGHPDIWAIGDCASIPLGEKDKCPPTAQFAIREAKTLASNIAATSRNEATKPFFFKSLGMLGALGHHSAVAELFGKIKLSGFLAWMMWRAIYWMKIPGIDRKIKIAFSWLLDMIIPLEEVQLKIANPQGIAHFHFEKGEVIFHEGDVGDYLYIVVSGSIEVYREADGNTIATIGQGEFFGEMALLNQKTRTLSARCAETTELLAIRKGEFDLLIANFEEMKQRIHSIEEMRKAQ